MNTKGYRKYKGLIKCTVCKKMLEASLENFYLNISKNNGFSTECKKCKKLYQKGRNDFLKSKRVEFIKEHNNKCFVCKIYNDNPSFFDIDHITPVRVTKVSRALPTYYSNLIYQVLCPNCHRLKTIKENNENK